MSQHQESKCQEGDNPESITEGWEVDAVSSPGTNASGFPDVHVGRI